MSSRRSRERFLRSRIMERTARPFAARAMRRALRSESFSQRAASAVVASGERYPSWPMRARSWRSTCICRASVSDAASFFASREMDFTPSARDVALVRRKATRRSCRPSGSPRRMDFRALFTARARALRRSPGSRTGRYYMDTKAIREFTRASHGLHRAPERRGENAPAMRTLGAIDIGTNSIKLLVANVEDEGTLEVLLREKAMV